MSADTLDAQLSQISASASTAPRSTAHRLTSAERDFEIASDRLVCAQRHLVSQLDRFIHENSELAEMRRQCELRRAHELEQRRRRPPSDRAQRSGTIGAPCEDADELDMKRQIKRQIDEICHSVSKTASFVGLVDSTHNLSLYIITHLGDMHSANGGANARVYRMILAALRICDISSRRAAVK